MCYLAIVLPSLSKSIQIYNCVGESNSHTLNASLRLVSVRELGWSSFAKSTVLNCPKRFLGILRVIVVAFFFFFPGGSTALYSTPYKQHLRGRIDANSAEATGRDRPTGRHSQAEIKKETGPRMTLFWTPSLLHILV